MTNDENIRISNLETEVSQLGGAVARLDTEVSRLNDRMGSVENRVARLEGEFSQMNERMASLERSMLHLSSRVDRLFWAIIGVGGAITVTMAGLVISVWLQ